MFRKRNLVVALKAIAFSKLIIERVIKCPRLRQFTSWRLITSRFYENPLYSNVAWLVGKQNLILKCNYIYPFNTTPCNQPAQIE